MKPTVLLLKDIITAFNSSLTATYKSPLTVSGGYTIEVSNCDLLHLREGSIITINSVEYTVIEIVNNTIKVSGSSNTILSNSTFIYPDVFYFHGTPIMVGNELNYISDADNKTPFIYLYEVLQDEFIEEIGSSIDRNSDLRLFFLDQSNFKDWDTEHHYNEAIVPMSRLTFKFIEFLKKNKNIGLLPNYSMIYHANFTIKYTINGNETRLFNDELSGVELKINLPFKKVEQCC